MFACTSGTKARACYAGLLFSLLGGDRALQRARAGLARQSCADYLQMTGLFVGTAHLDTLHKQLPAALCCFRHRRFPYYLILYTQSQVKMFLDYEQIYDWSGIEPTCSKPVILANLSSALLQSVIAHGEYPLIGPSWCVSACSDYVPEHSFQPRA
jgi:hypothetical protein